MSSITIPVNSHKQRAVAKAKHIWHIESFSIIASSYTEAIRYFRAWCKNEHD